MERNRWTTVLAAIAVAVAGMAVPEAAANQPAREDVRPATATRRTVNPFKGLPPGVFIVGLDSPAVAVYEGGIGGLRPTSTRGAAQLDTTLPDAVAYRAHLERRQALLLSRMRRDLGRSITPRHSYFNAANAVAVRLTAEEAARVLKMPGVESVRPEVIHHIDTDSGPGWIGAPGVWDGSAAGRATRGEGIVIGVLDTGINPDNPSFADIGGDGYDHTNPRGAGSYVGVCDPGGDDYQPGFPCNDKLIGAWNFTFDPGPRDDVGHGSHTAAIAAGNVVDAKVEGPTMSFATTLSGVAPHANLIVYDVCNPAGCPGSAILAAIDQAIADGVDVINYSIGTDTPSNPWEDADQLAFLAAREAGIFVAHSAGNEGPGAGTTGAPNAPWMMHVGATTHPRRFANSVGGFTGGETRLADIRGAGFTAGYGPAPIVYAGDYPSDLTDTPELCGAGALGEEVSPWPEGTFTDEIVVCDRGIYGRVEKSANVRAAGGAGFVLVDDGTGVSGDAHELPGVHIDAAAGKALKDWLAGGNGHTAAIGGAELIDDPDTADMLGAFSSRGPNASVDIVLPSLVAPGVDILAATGRGGTAEWDFLTGTSMASPHVAGAAALLMALNPDWSPAEVQSALMLTASTPVFGEDGAPVGPFDRGSGRLDLAAAATSLLIMDETGSDYRNADPAAGGDVTALNLPSMANSACVLTCSWTRTVTATAAASWRATGHGEGGLAVTVSPERFTLAAGESVQITITADVSAALGREYVFGHVLLEPTGEPGSPASMPIAVAPSAGEIPRDVRITTRRDAGTWRSGELVTLEVTDLTATVDGLAIADRVEAAIRQDSDAAAVFDNPLDGTHIQLLDVPAGTTTIIAEVLASTAPDLDMYVGRDVDGDGIPAEDEVECVSASSSPLESCRIEMPAPGSWWVLIQNWRASAPDAVDSLQLATAVLDGIDAGNLRVAGPTAAGPLEPFSLELVWEEPGMVAGDRLYGNIVLGTDPSREGNLGTVAVVVERLEDDVRKEVSRDLAMTGDTVTFEITIEPNVMQDALEYSITDTIPDGLTYVPGSVSGGATVRDGELTWQGTMPSPLRAEGSYEVTTSADDAACRGPFAGGGYVDLAEFGIVADPELVGDTVTFTAFESHEMTFYGARYTGLAFSDDGFVVFGSDADFGETPWIAQAIPDPAAPNNLAAVLWQDFELVHDEAANSGVSVATVGDDNLLVVEFDDIRLFGRPGRVMDMELVIRPNVDDTPGAWEILMAYEDVARREPGTIGVENATGTEAVSVPAGVVEDGAMVCFDWVGASFDPVVITYQATVDRATPLGSLGNEVVSVTDGAGSRPATTGAELLVVDTPVAELTDAIAQLDSWIENPPSDLGSVDVAGLEAARDHIVSALTPDRWVRETTLDPVLGRRVFSDLRRAVRALRGLTKWTSLHADKNLLKIELAFVAEHLAHLAYAEAVGAGAAEADLKRALRKMARAEMDQAFKRWHRSIKNHRRSWASSVKHLLAP